MPAVPQIMENHDVLIRRLQGLEPYEAVWRRMLDFTLGRDEHTLDEFWVLQHAPVFTLGQAGRREHILDAHQVPVVATDRGGQVTYHGPGQLVVYLLVDVKRRGIGVRQLVDLIENSIIRLLADYGISAESRRDAPGVYVDGSKIAALGLRIKRGCAYHGLSFNIDMDLTPFEWINPCGYEGLKVAQLKDLLPQPHKDLFSQAEERLLRELRQNLLYCGSAKTAKKSTK